MQQSTKNLLKSIVVLSIIALVCVAILSLANVFLKTEISLDKATVKFLNEKFATTEQTFTGVDSDTAYNEDYFVMLTDSELEVATGYTYKSFKSNSNNYLRNQSLISGASPLNEVPDLPLSLTGASGSSS